MRYPDIYEVILDSCCVQRIEAIKRCTKAFKFADKFLLIGTSLSIFFGPGVTGKYSSLGSVGVMSSVSSTEWGLLAQALSKIPNIQKAAVYEMAAMHKLHHDNRRGGNHNKLAQFWSATAEAFSSQ